MNRLVSILIPAYNAEPWIADAIQSALLQTWQRKEIIIVDDGSTDRTLSIARRFESETVRVFAQSNQGAAATRNKAFSLCHGDYIQWLDADDVLAHDKIALQLGALRTADSRLTLFAGAWGRFYHRLGKATFTPSPLWCDLSATEWLLRKMEKDCFMQTATWLVSRELTERAGPWDTRLLGDDDGEYFCRVQHACDVIRFVPGARVYYREIGANRLSNIGWSSRKLESQFLSIQLHIGHIRSLEDSTRSRSACVKYLQKYMVHFYPERPDIIRHMQELAGALGGTLQTPRLSWKYRWIQKAFGWRAGKTARTVVPQLRRFLVRSWDKAMLFTENRNRWPVATALQSQNKSGPKSTAAIGQ